MIDRHSLISLLVLLLPVAAWSISCPNNGNMLKVKDSLQEVLHQCGQPTSLNRFKNTTIVSANWVYYRTNITNRTHTKMSILFNQGRVANISIILSGANEQNVRSSLLCRMPIQVGNTMNYVQSVCGAPLTQQTLQTASIDMTELKYDGISPNTLILENDSLKSWR